MNQERIRKYAKLLAKMGIAVQPKEEVWINAELDQPDFVRMVVEECYAAGASEVKVFWHDDKTARLQYKYQSVSTLGKLKNFELDKYKYMAKKMPSILHIISEDPDAFKGINQNKITKSRAKIYPKIRKYRDQIDGKYKWCIGAVPSVAWAKKVFPKDSEEIAVEKLWEAILTTSRVDSNDPIVNWENHNNNLISKREKLESLRLVSLEYKSSSGTDFKVGLNPNMKWGAGIEKTPTKGSFNPNIPTEEVFSTPIAGKAEGTLVASLPLSYQGQLIEDFSITFKDGKVSSVKARKNQKLLEQMVSMDEGASKLGEVALVPFSSPINQTGILFYNTLFDENAVCHCALGIGFPELLPGGLEMTPEEIKKAGVNHSMIHVDFMIGTSDLSILGTSEDGKVTQIFKDGEWAI